MFQCEIKNAYFQEKHKPKNSNQFISKKQKSKTSLYQYVIQNYGSDQKIRNLLQKAITNNFLQDQDIKSENYQNKKNFYLSKCLDRIRQQHCKQQYLIQYTWFYDNKSNDNFKVFEKACQILNEQYKKWNENQPFQQWLEEQEKQKQKKIDKRKKRKNKKQKQPKVHEESNDQIQKKQQYCQQQGKLLIREVQLNEGDGENESQINEKISQTKQLIPQNMRQEYIYRPSDNLETNQQQYMQVQQGLHLDKEIQQRKKHSHLIGSNANKKVIRQRINQYYHAFTQQLYQSALAYDKYRKAVYQVIFQFLKEQIIQPLSNEQKQIEWKLVVYGSAAAGFSMKHSDIDLVLLTNSRKVNLKDIQQKMKFFQWAIDCKLIQAHIPIVTVQVSLQCSNVASKQLTNKHLKKIEGQLFSVDLTISSIQEPHSGIQNTKQLKQIFDTYPNIRSICLLLKDYLRLRNLNKPYKGGINSYVLIVMIHAILSRKNIISQETTPANSGQYRQIRQISLFMESEFIPFETVISCKKNCIAKPDHTLHLNVANPKTQKLLKTSAFNILKIIAQFRKLREFQQQLEKQLQLMNVNQKKTMRNHFIQSFRQFLEKFDE